jgi:hypothetical protein
VAYYSIDFMGTAGQYPAGITPGRIRNGPKLRLGLREIQLGGLGPARFEEKQKGRTRRPFSQKLFLFLEYQVERLIAPSLLRYFGVEVV